MRPFSETAPKQRYRDQEGAQNKEEEGLRPGVSPSAVIIGDYTDEAVEEYVRRASWRASIGAYTSTAIIVPIEVEGADWVDKDDSLLKAQVAVQVR